MRTIVYTLYYPKWNGLWWYEPYIQYLNIQHIQSYTIVWCTLPWNAIHTILYNLTMYNTLIYNGYTLQESHTILQYKIDCVLLLQNVFSSYRVCSLTYTMHTILKNLTQSYNIKYLNIQDNIQYIQYILHTLGYCDRYTLYHLALGLARQPHAFRRAT